MAVPVPRFLRIAQTSKLVLLADLERLCSQLLACFGFAPNLYLLQRTSAFGQNYMKWG